MKHNCAVTVVVVQLPDIVKFGDQAWYILIHSKIWAFALEFSVNIIHVKIFCVDFNREIFFLCTNNSNYMVFV